MKEPKTGRTTWIVRAVGILLLSRYIGAYYWAVDTFPLILPAPPPSAGFKVVVEPVYNIHLEEAAHAGGMPPPQVVFFPIHCLDRLLRPGTWNSKFPASGL